MAFSQAYRKTGGATYTLFGDGAINQGTHNEALNLAGLYKLPCIFIVENNGMAMGTQVERSSAEPDLAKRGAAYGMPAWNIDGNDIDTVIAELGKALHRARAGEGPSYVVANTYRFRGHSMSDPMKYRSKEEADRARQRDPITLYQDRLQQRGLLTDEQIERMTEEVAEEINQAAAQADADPNPQPDDRFSDVLAEQYPYLPR
jgi:pyruvate dehydrogenase E1 component alpha subunit